jgi:hypothetical protein
MAGCGRDPSGTSLHLSGGTKHRRGFFCREFSVVLSTRSIIRHLEQDRMERKSMRSISGEHETRVLDRFKSFGE